MLDETTRDQILAGVSSGELDVAEALQRLTEASQNQSEPVEKVAQKNSAVSTQEALQHALTLVISAEIKTDMALDRPETPFDRYGFDSVMALKVVQLLEKTYGPLSPTLLFEFRSIADLAGHLYQTYPEPSQRLVAGTVPGEPIDTPSPTVRVQADQVTQPPANDRNEVAIIGMAAKMPEASTATEFWDRLVSGYDAIREIPDDRWDKNQDFNPEPGVEGTTYLNRGSFIDGFDEFDASFFHLSAREAEFMDPQERLFLQTVWHSLEDARLTRDDIAGQDVGIYVGVMYSHYQRWSAEQQILDNPLYLGSSYASIANRVSFILDARGPSFAVDSMCSSSLAAIHLAREAINRGEIETAIVGGVNLSIHPGKFIDLSQGRYASTDGKCRSFGEGGTGYGPGEGVGAVVLRSRSSAEQNGNRIHALLTGSAIGHGGKTQGYSAPSPDGQAKIVNQALTNAARHPDDISYIEAHGTGTPLGDPIEVRGLAQVFGQRSAHLGPCAIGSVKSNIGHLEGAAGIAALMKVVLQLKNRQLVPSLHGTPANPSVDFASANLQLQEELRPWNVADRPRIAGISSFGAGGLNSHIVVEESPERPPAQPTQNSKPNQETLVVVSAQSQESLRALSGQLADHVESGDYELTDLAYSSRVTRTPLAYRLAVVTSSKQQAVQSLRNYATGHEPDGESTVEGWIDDPDRDIIERHQIQAAIATQSWRDCAQYWVTGAAIELADLNLPLGEPVDLPLYPFANIRHWPDLVSRESQVQTTDHRTHSSEGSTRLATITPDDTVVNDHRVAGRLIVPGARLVELAINHAQADPDLSTTGLVDIVFQQPVELDQPTDVWLTPQGNSFEIQTSGPDGVKQTNAQFRYSPSRLPSTTAHVDVEQYRRQANQILDRDQCYGRLQNRGLDYGASLQLLQRLHVGDDTVLGEIDPSTAGSFTQVMDAGMQSIVGLAAPDSDTIQVPFSLKAVNLYGDIQTVRSVVAKRLTQNKTDSMFDLTLIADDNTIVVELQGLFVRNLSQTRSRKPQLVTLRPNWAATNTTPVSSGQSRNVVVISTGISATGAKILNEVEGAGHRRSKHVVSKHNQQPTNGAFVVEDLTSETAWAALCNDIEFANTDFVVVHDSPIPVASGNTTTVFETQHVRENLLFLTAFSKALSRQALVKGSGRMVSVYPAITQQTAPRMQAEGAFMKTVNAENPGLVFSTLAVDDSPELWDVIQRELDSDRTPGQQVRLLNGQLETLAVEEFDLGQRAAKSPIRPGGHYLVSGGMGGLGRIVAQDLAQNHGANVTLIGRSELGPEAQRFLDSMATNTGTVNYCRADITDQDALQSTIAAATQQLGPLKGVFHLAGLLRDGLVLTKTAEAAVEVSNPKVLGAVNLDRLTAESPLDFFCLFSSASSLVGVPGQTDYAYANGYLNGFVSTRNSLQQQDLRNGTSLSLIWPLWAEGGMTVTDDAIREIRRVYGWEPLPKTDALDAMYRAITAAKDLDEVAVFYGDQPTILRSMGVDDLNEQRRPNDKAEAKETEVPHDAETQLETFLRSKISTELRLPTLDLGRRQRFDHLGLESVMMMNITREIEQKLGPIPKTIFFECANLDQLSTYLLNKFPQQVTETFSTSASPSTGSNTDEPNLSRDEGPTMAEPEQPTVDITRPPTIEPSTTRRDPSPISMSNDAIAIVGLAGRYPMAETIDELSEVLRAGKDCITEVPPQRWDHSRYFNPDKSAVGTSYTKWGGFLDNIDAFDPLLFNISPRDAKLMDPQERLFLQTVWHSLEDAGHSSEMLKEAVVGVFAGVMYADYQLYGADGRNQNEGFTPASLAAAVANRVSFAFDFTGPSIGLDTMCSSSLSAIHLACMSLRNGDCDMAIAGGVNVIAHPNHFLQISAGKFAATDGRCRSFGQGGDGYVPGEGVGAIVLRPLRDAERDGNTILGLIRGSAMNHGGRTNGYTVPSPAAQARVIRRSLQSSKIEPREVDYIEAHGTGTELGDPIELAGLAEVFNGRGTNSGLRPIPIGSVKSNIGHVESAAGIAGISKVLLQLKHKTLYPSLHADTLNPHLDLGNNFVVQRTLEPWVAVDGDVAKPLVACVSAFGAGGSNAHVTLEEYVKQPAVTVAEDSPELIVLSARTTEQLTTLAENLLSSLQIQTPVSTKPSRQLGPEIRAVVARMTALPLEEVDMESDLSSLGLDRVGRAQVGRELGVELGESWLTIAEAVALHSPEGGESPESRRHSVGSSTAYSLADIAYTLRVGRTRLAERLAFVASSKSDLINHLEGFISGASSEVSLCRGRGTDESGSSSLLEVFAGDHGDSFIQEVAASGDLHRLAQLWVAGVDIKIPSDGARRVSLPLYPFGQDRYWVPHTEPSPEHGSRPSSSLPGSSRVSVVSSVTENGSEDSLPDPSGVSVTAPVTENHTTETLIETITDTMSTLLEIDHSDLARHIPHVDLGVDSVTAVEIVDRLSAELSIDLAPTDFFNHETIERLATYILTLAPTRNIASNDTVAPPMGNGSDNPTDQKIDVEPTTPITSPTPAIDQIPAANVGVSQVEVAGSTDVAIVGISGQFPGFVDVDALWQGLVNGQDMVTEVPAGRWDWRQHWDPNGASNGKTYSKWGSYLDDVDLFDPDFFAISPREARLMDPQQRLFLQQAWCALENAGYTSENLDGVDCHTYVGIATGDYDQLLKSYGIPTEGYTFTGTHPAIGASRCAYLLNLTGPSLALDTSCSSSLMAIHLACEAIRSGRAEIALAGGVAALFTPQLHVYASNAKMLSPTGRCRAFDDGADGFVPGEGVGAVVLKRLDHAVADGDPIRAVIKGSAANQDGKSNGLTAPSESAQTAVEQQVYTEFGIDPSQIGYVECHGTGTKLGDPIEIKALTNSFRAFTDQTGYCAIGSIKSNLGHTLTAAGVASLLKVVLCLENQQLVPTLHVENPNRFIDFDTSPFRLNLTNTRWEAPAGGQRLAAVSSFGFSGTNVHAVVGEAQVPQQPEPSGPFLILVSGSSDTVLRQQAQQLHSYLTSNQHRVNLAELAYTLTVGRSHGPERLAIVTASSHDLLEKLSHWLRTGQQSSTYQTSGLLNGLADRYRAGQTITWDDISSQRPRRMALPSKPFDLQSYWPNTNDLAQSVGGQSKPVNDGYVFDHYKDADWDYMSVTLSPEDPVVSDHIVNNQMLVPAAGHLSMVLQAVALRLGRYDVNIAKAVWLRPLIITAPTDVRVAMQETGDSQLTYQVQTLDADGTATVHSRGRIAVGSGQPQTSIDVTQMLNSCPASVSTAEHYSRFTRIGIDYRAFFQTVEAINHSETELIASLKSSQPQGEVVSAGVLDGAIQVVAALQPEKDQDRPHVPFAMEKIRFIKRVPDHCYAYVRQDEPGSCSIVIVDRDGSPCIEIDGMAYRELKAPPSTIQNYSPTWIEADTPTGTRQPAGDVAIVASRADADLASALAALHPDKTTDIWWISEDLDLSSIDTRTVGRIYFITDLATPTSIDRQGMFNYGRLEAAQQNGVHTLLPLSKKLDARTNLEVVIVTANLHNPNGTGSTKPTRPFGSSVAGFARSLAAERTEWNVKVVDIDYDELLSGQTTNVAQKIADESGVGPFDELALRADQRWIRRLASADINPKAVSPYRQNGTYLIVGGAGGIGYELAQHIARSHQANIVLVGRRDASDRTDEMIRTINAAGGIAHYISGDVTSPGDMVRVVAATTERFGQIHGVFHSAIKLDDCVIERMDTNRLQGVLDPKVAGSMALAEAVADIDLDFFAFFSSVQSFSGNPGQSNYAASCRFKDSYALALRDLGIPATVINWGYWGSVGVVASDRYRREMETLGVHSIEPAEGFAALDNGLSHKAEQLVIIKADEPILTSIGVISPRADTTNDGTDPRAAVAASDAARHADRIVDSYQKLDALGIHGAWTAAVALGYPSAVNQRCVAADIANRLNITPAHLRLWKALVDQFQTYGYIQLNGSELITTAKGEDAAKVDVGNALRQSAHEMPEVAAHIDLLQTCLEQYQQVLTGAVSPTEVMFPGGSFSKVEPIYQGDVLSDALNSIVAETVDQYLTQSSKPTTKILEIGAGTGGTSKSVFEMLTTTGHDVEYTYTDISTGLLRNAKRTFGNIIPKIEFESLDIESDPSTQDFDLNSFDIILASNVLHATTSLTRTMSNISSLLSADGRVVLSETTTFSAFATLTFGLLPGWWLSEDTERRIPHSPLADPETWCSLLNNEVNCPQTRVIPALVPTTGEIGQVIVVGERTGLVAPTSQPVTNQTFVQNGNGHQNGASYESQPRADKQSGIHRNGADETSPLAVDLSAGEPNSGEGLDVGSVLANCLATVLGREAGTLDFDRPFTEYGLDSIVLVELVDLIDRELGTELTATSVFDHPTLNQLADHITATWPNVGSAPSTSTAESASDLELLEMLVSGDVSLDMVVEQMDRK